MSLNVAVIGNGAREEAIKAALQKSSLCKTIVDISTHPDLIIFGPENPICEGLPDEYRKQGIRCIAVNKQFSQLESSKLFAKMFMAENCIKCARLLPLESSDFPQVVKFDGLCKGKGVKVVYNTSEKNEFTRKFPGQKYFIEEYLEGEEISLMSFFNGKKLINFLPARDFKKLNADKNSPNTGGMGAYCPVKLNQIQQESLNIYLENLERALLKENADFEGFIYSGLIWTRDDWYVLEYNVRLGDPETQAILTHLKNDFLDILMNGSEPQYHDGTSACLVVASKGYPDVPVKGDEIILPDNPDNIKIYNAGVKEVNGKLFSDGGRVLSLCVNSGNPFPILKEYAEKIQMKHKYFRDDIDI